MRQVYFAFWQIVFLAALCSDAAAGFMIRVGDHQLLPNTSGQRIDIRLSSNSSSDPFLNGMNFRARLGDGSGTQGVFSGVSGTTNGVILKGGEFFWDISPNGSTVGGQGPVFGAPAFAELSVNFNNDGSTQALREVGIFNSVRIATILVDTSGLFSGTYAIDLSDSLAFGIGPTNVIGAGGTESSVAITNGTFNITAVPEPSPLLLLFVLATAFFCFQRKLIFKCLPF